MLLTIIIIAVIIFLFFNFLNYQDFKKSSYYTPTELNNDKKLYTDDQQAIYFNENLKKYAHYHRESKEIRTQHCEHAFLPNAYYLAKLLEDCYLPHPERYPQYDHETAIMVDRFFVAKEIGASLRFEHYGVDEDCTNQHADYIPTWKQVLEQGSGDILMEGEDTPILIFYTNKLLDTLPDYDFYFLADHSIVAVFSTDRTFDSRCAFHLDHQLNLIDVQEEQLHEYEKNKLARLKNHLIEDKLASFEVYSATQ